MNISVIIPTYNSEETIQRALNSVVVQTFAPSEIIVVDDCSVDKTYEILDRFRLENSGKNNIRLFKNSQNSGPAHTRNKGIQEATGDWIAFLDADDFWHPQKLEIQMEVATKSNCQFIGSTCKIVPEVNERITGSPQFKTLKPYQFLFKNFFVTPSVIIKRTSLLQFSEEMKHSEDYDLWIKMMRHYGSSILITNPLVTLGKPAYLSGGLSSELWKMQSGEMKALSQEKNFILRAVSLCFSLLKFVRRLAITVFYRILRE